MGTLLDSQPKCEVINVTENFTESEEFRCSVKYRGNWRPSITWTYNGKAVQGKSNDSIDTVSSTVKVKGNGLTNYTDYRCVVYFTSGSANEEGYAKNLPSNFSCFLGQCSL